MGTIGIIVIALIRNDLQNLAGQRCSQFLSADMVVGNGDNGLFLVLQAVEHNLIIRPKGTAKKFR